MTRPTLIRRPAARSGLTLVETLAAVALLAAIASACLGMLRGLQTRAETPRHDGSQLPWGVAEVLADALMQSPARFGLGSHRDLAAQPRVLPLDDQLVHALSLLASHASPHIGSSGAPMARAWIVESSDLTPKVRATHRPGDQPHHTTATACWLFVQIGDDTAARSIVLHPGPAR